MIDIARMLSPTAINTYLSCPRKFYLRYIKKLRTKLSIYLVRGNVIHRVLERFSREGIQTSLDQVPVQLLRLFDWEWKNAESRLKGLKLTPSELATFWEESRLMLINFYFWLKRSNCWPPFRSEMRMVSKKLGLMGIVDAIHRIDGKAVVVDYKTSRRMDLTPDIQRQAALYAALYQDFFGEPPEAVWIHFLAFDQDPRIIEVDRELISYGRMVTESIHKKTLSQEEADYPCTCGGRCEQEFIPE